MTVVVRPTIPDDMAELLAMLRELAAFEQAPPDALGCTEAAFRRDGFGPGRRFECLFAEAEGSVAGFITLLPGYSSWLALPGLVIHDLFVRAAARGQGVATALVAAAKRLAEDRHCGRIDVNVLSWNSARVFYEKQGFAPQADWMLHRFVVADRRKEASP